MMRGCGVEVAGPDREAAAVVSARAGVAMGVAKVGKVSIGSPGDGSPAHEPAPISPSNSQLPTNARYETAAIRFMVRFLENFRWRWHVVG